MLTENQLWLLSFYRTSEISGALFFGRLARTMKPGTLQRDMTKHFADESQHAWYWTDCIAQLGGEALRLDAAYQDQYMAAAGMPANMMEVLALTQVFERRVINQYARHRKMAGEPELVRATLVRIMRDERWHIQWIRDALAGMAAEFGKDAIRSTLRKFTKADQEVYQKTLAEHQQRVDDLLVSKG